jgi:hypothetical protein
LVEGGTDYLDAMIRGAEAAFYVGDDQVTLEQFTALGEAYWRAFGNRAAKRHERVQDGVA